MTRKRERRFRFSSTLNKVRMVDKTCFCDNNQKSSDIFDETCIFCTIAKGEDPHTTILAKVKNLTTWEMTSSYLDEDIVCFKDINPGAPHHYLVIPKKHIHSCLSLKADDMSLVRRMAEMGRDVLKANNVADFEDISLGFHVPPYITVPHLHLHVLAPFSQTFIWSRFKFQNFWYLTEERCLKELRKKSQKIRKGNQMNACCCVNRCEPEET